MKVNKLIGLAAAATLTAGLAFQSVAFAAPNVVPANDVPTRSLVQAPAAPNHLDLTMNGQAVVSKQTETEVGPGVWLTEFERLEPRGWQQGAVLDVDLSNPAVSLDYLYTGKVASTSTVRKLADEAENIAGAINGDGFDINNSGASNGIGIDPVDGVVEAPNTPVDALVIDKNNIAQITRATTEGKIVSSGFELPVAMVNYPSILDRDKDTAVGIYTSYWGDYKRLNKNGDRDQSVEIWIDETSKVTKTAQPVGEGAIPAGTRVIVARPGAAADKLKSAKLGDNVQVSYVLRTNADQPSVGIGGWHGNDIRIVQDGANRNIGGADVHPRTSVGVNQDGTRLLMAVIDGRSTNSRGMTLAELGDLMVQLGAYNALNFDGGGSTTLVARDPGDTDTTVINTPSDGTERQDGNGLGVAVKPGVKGLTGFNVQPAAKTTNANRVFPGVHRSLIAKGHDENLSAVDGKPTSWASSDDSIATVDGDGIVTGLKPGKVTITAANGEATGTYDIEVTGDLARVQASKIAIGIPNAGDVVPLRFTGFDSQGFGAPIDPADIGVDIADGFTATSTDAATLAVSSDLEKSATLATFTIGEFVTEIPVTVGSDILPITDLSDAADWTFQQARASGEISATTDPDGKPAIRLTHNFDQSTGTRGSYAVAPNDGIMIPGQPTTITLRMKGDGYGAWPRLQVKDGNGSVKQINATSPEYITFNEWQTVTFNVPAGTVYPLTLQKVRIMETQAAHQYKGDITFSQLNAVVPQSVELPPASVYKDPAVSLLGAADNKPLRIAVVSDAQFVGRDPKSANAEAARAVLAQVVERKPDRILIVGDWVDEGAPEDIALAKQIIDEGLAGTNIPWTYVPGNHEAMGAPDMAPWKAVFGDNTTVTDVDRTRIITLDSHPYNISYDPKQVQFLEQQLNDAKTNPDITGVVLALHHPTQDNLTGASALNDPQDARLIEQWMADVRAAGKSALVINAGVGAFDVYQVDGAIHFTNGNSGKDPHSTPERGGFTGWTMMGINPANGLWKDATGNWLAIEVNPFVDSLAITGPDAVKAQDSIALSATITQDDREVPVAWPVSYLWSSQDKHVYVGEAEAAPADAVAAIDPATGVVTALDRLVVDGRLVLNDTNEYELLADQASQYPITLSVTVNGVTTTHQVTVSVPNAKEKTTPEKPAVEVNEPAKKATTIAKKLPRTGNITLAETGSQGSALLVVFAGIAATALAYRRHTIKTTN